MSILHHFSGIVKKSELIKQGNRMKILLNYVDITQIKYGYILQERNNKACLLQNIILES